MLFCCCFVLQVFGPESSGKSTLALHAIAEVQRNGGNACLIDAENAFHRQYAKVRSNPSVAALHTHSSIKVTDAHQLHSFKP